MDLINRKSAISLSDNIQVSKIVGLWVTYSQGYLKLKKTTILAHLTWINAQSKNDESLNYCKDSLQEGLDIIDQYIIKNHKSIKKIDSDEEKKLSQEDKPVLKTKIKPVAVSASQQDFEDSERKRKKYLAKINRLEYSNSTLLQKNNDLEDKNKSLTEKVSRHESTINHYFTILKSVQKSHALVQDAVNGVLK